MKMLVKLDVLDYRMKMKVATHRSVKNSCCTNAVYQSKKRAKTKQTRNTEMYYSAVLIGPFGENMEFVPHHVGAALEFELVNVPVVPVFAWDRHRMT